MTTKTNNNRADRGANKKRGNTPAESKADTRANLARQFNIRPKTKELVDMLLDDKTLTQSEAYRRLHPNASVKTSQVEASKVLAKPSVIGYKDAAVGKAKKRIVSLVNSDNESIALKASQDIIDRNEGKAIQKNESTSRTVHVSLDLTGLKLGNHYVAPKPLPAE